MRRHLNIRKAVHLVHNLFHQHSTWKQIIRDMLQRKINRWNLYSTEYFVLHILPYYAGLCNYGTVRRQVCRWRRRPPATEGKYEYEEYEETDCRQRPIHDSLTVKSMLFLSTLWRHISGAEVQLHLFSTSALDAGEWATSRIGCFTSGERTPVLT
jgi:hypothetical protein